MENHNTFSLEHVLNVESWLVVGQAMLKMASFFWPVILIAVVFMVVEHRKEQAR